MTKFPNSLHCIGIAYFFRYMLMILLNPIIRNNNENHGNKKGPFLITYFYTCFPGDLINKMMDLEHSLTWILPHFGLKYSFLLVFLKILFNSYIEFSYFQGVRADIRVLFLIFLHSSAFSLSIVSAVFCSLHPYL